MVRDLPTKSLRDGKLSWGFPDGWKEFSLNLRQPKHAVVLSHVPPFIAEPHET